VVSAVAFSPSGETVASAAKDKTIRFWNVKEGKEIGVLKKLSHCSFRANLLG